MFDTVNTVWLKICKSTIILLLIGSIPIFAQPTSNRFFFSGSEIVVDVLPGNDIYYSHLNDEGISIYNLANIFQVSEEIVAKANKIDSKNPNNKGKIVKIPIPPSKIVTNPSQKPNKKAHVIIKYVVKQGDNLFKIARQYFDADIQSIVLKNNKKSTDVNVGEVLNIGWLPIDLKISATVENKNNIAQSKKQVTTTKDLKTNPSKPQVTVSTTPTTSSSKDVKIIKYYLSDVIGLWDKTSANHKSHFVLHNDARPGSVMDIYNPMLKKHIKAKVLGKIPVGTYDVDTQIIISGLVAKDLGILDSRFKVNIKYEQ